MTVVLALERYLAITKPIEYHNAIQGQSEDGILLSDKITCTLLIICSEVDVSCVLFWT